MHRDENNQNIVVVRKKDLIDALKDNREQHRKDFETALDGFEKTVIATLKERLAEAKKGVKRPVYVSLQMPEDHTKDYDRRVRMYEMDTEDTVELTEQEFAMYVQDDWGWKGQWTTSNSSYMAASVAS